MITEVAAIVCLILVLIMSCKKINLLSLTYIPLLYYGSDLRLKNQYETAWI